MYFSKRKLVSLVGFGFSQMWKISDAKTAGSVVTSVLKKLSQLSRKAVTAIMRQLLLWAEVDEVSWAISDCWRGHSAFISWIWLKMVRSLSRVSCYFGYNNWLLGFQH